MDTIAAKKRAEFFGLLALVSISAIGINAALALLIGVLLSFITGQIYSIDLFMLVPFLLTASLGLLSIPAIKSLRKYSKKFVTSVVVAVGVWVGLFLSSTYLAPNFYPLSILTAVLPIITTWAFFVLWIAALIASVAVSKGRDWASFFVLSLFFPIIMWIVVSVMSVDTARATTDVGLKKCPRCAELVKSEATLCKHCGTELS
jgi:hypothetical protein